MVRTQRNGNVLMRFPSGVFPLMAIAMATDTVKIEMRVEVVGDNILTFLSSVPWRRLRKPEAERKTEVTDRQVVLMTVEGL